MKRNGLIALTISTLILCLGIFGCAGQQSTTNQSSDQVSNESSSSNIQEAQEENQNPDLSQEIIGVWEKDGWQIALDGENFLSTKSDGYSKYVFDAENSDIKLTDIDMNVHVDSVDDGEIAVSDAITATFKKTKEDPKKFIKKNHVVLKPGETWKNKSISIKVISFGYYDDGDKAPIADNMVSYVTEPEYIVAIKVINRTGKMIGVMSPQFVLNGEKPSALGSQSEVSINPYDESGIQYSYSVSASARKSIKTIQAGIRFSFDSQIITDGEDQDYVTPWITIKQK